MTCRDDGPPRIVLADDHPAVLAAFGRLLKPDCDVVASVPNGQAAIDAVDRLRPEVLVVDLMMPDLDGLEVCRQVKRMVPDTLVIIVTAFDDAHEQSLALQEGASAFIAKPAAPSTLPHTIQQLVAERRRIRQHAARIQP